MQEKCQNLSPKQREAINFIAWRPHHILQHNSHVTSVAITDSIIVTGSYDGTIKIWDRNNYQEITTLEGSGGCPVASIAIVGNIIVTESYGIAKIWDRNNYQEVTLKGHGLIHSIAVADDIIVTESYDAYDNAAKVWDRNNYQELATLKGHDDYVELVAIADDIIITVSRDGTAKIWDRNTYQELATLEKKYAPLERDIGGNKSITIADDIIATESGDYIVRVWNKNNYQELAALKGSLLTITDGIIVTESSCDRTAKVWDRNNYKELATLRGHDQRINSVAVGDDIIVTGSYDKNAKVWDRNTYQELATLKMPYDYNDSIGVSVAIADSIIVTGSANGAARIWNSKPFAGTVENNPLLWILSHATTQQWDFIKRVCEAKKSLPYRYFFQEGKSQERDSKTYLSFPEAVQQYLNDRLNILKK